MFQVDIHSRANLLCNCHLMCNYVCLLIDRKTISIYHPKRCIFHKLNSFRFQDKWILFFHYIIEKIKLEY